MNLRLGIFLGALLLPAASLAAEAEWVQLHQAGRASAALSHPAWETMADIDWSRADGVDLRLYPQQALSPGLDAPATIRARLRGVSDGKRLALRLEWPDALADAYSTTHTDRFADALAVQFAGNDGDTLPYIGMGEPERPVRLWFWRAGRGAEALSARGFGALETDPEATPPAVDSHRTAAGWVVTLSGPLPADGNPLALSIALWDGAEAGRDGRKRLSPWRLLRLPDAPLDPARISALVSENHSDGDPQRGRRLAGERGCIACHQLPGHPAPAAALGPDLTLAGAIHWPGYLRRAIADPSAFVLPKPEYGAAGASLMPPLELTPQELADLTAYLVEQARPQAAPATSPHPPARKR